MSPPAQWSAELSRLAEGDHFPRILVNSQGGVTRRTGTSERLFRRLACRPLRISPFFPGTGMRPTSPTCSGESGEVPDNEVDAHQGNPGSTVTVTLRSSIGRGDTFRNRPSTAHSGGGDRRAG